MKRFILFATALILTSCASIRISSDYDTNVDFSTYTTYAFFKPGIDKVEISDLDKRRVLRALESTLPTKGFSASETPDVLISFHTKAEKNVRVSESYLGWGSPFYGPYGGWGWGWGFNRPYNVNTTTTGLLYIDIIDATSKKLVWQGKGTGSLSKGTPQEREERIRVFVTEILAAYPPNANE
ncbi:MAG: Uncharacterised protein [Flavobacteriales bacterium]|jgi:hypothetical protein|nr:MAG: DUF4136 domain-containing protein [Flavobacteriales bacterium]CAI8318809.1 MAG: Uncharacterised protein [Flavobacteriales bacterium]|tara:strand:+ start:4239 stop:4784 length:546 start_codon:yes stop_codon:yes gene_type:complete